MAPSRHASPGNLAGGLLAAALLLSACLPADLGGAVAQSALTTPSPQPAVEVQTTPLPTRPPFSPGELVDYIAQPGDTLEVLALHFNTTVKEIRQANTFIPQDVTTMPPGMPMKIPIYYQALWGNPYQILPDALYVNGPAQRDFDPQQFAESHSGWLKDYSEYVDGMDRRGGEIVAFVALNYSVSPRLLLALLDYQLGALSQPTPPTGLNEYPLGQKEVNRQGLYRQLAWAANALNNAYYGWRSGRLLEINLLDGSLQRFDPWQNAATVALQSYFSLHFPPGLYAQAISPQGMAATYISLFGDPWNVEPHIPGSLRQPFLRLPFEPGKIWAYTGGPHSAWGDDQPLAAIDFAPPSVVGGCSETDEWAVAVADGLVVRSGEGVVVLDLDGDGDERTGWVIFYLHLATRDRVPTGTRVVSGQPLGHPSCEGGKATGTHVHIARKYNGEWILAEGTLAFNLDGWVAANGSSPYLGTLKKQGRVVEACVCSDQASQIQADFR